MNKKRRSQREVGVIYYICESRGEICATFGFLRCISRVGRSLRVRKSVPTTTCVHEGINEIPRQLKSKPIQAMNRLFSKIIVFSIAAVAGVVALSGCQSDPVSLTVRDFASIRVLNFLQSDMSTGMPSVPIDVYINRNGETPDTLATANNLSFGQASVYENNLTADAGGTSYDLTVRYTHSKSGSLITKTVTVLPGHRYSYVIFSTPNAPNQPTQIFVEDADVPADTNHTYVRFLNVQSDANGGPNPLTLRINDPVFGEVVGDGITFMNKSNYLALTTKNDSAYTLFVTPQGSSTILARLGFQSFAPGTYHTVVYAGDPLRVAPYDTTGNPADSLRIRVYDDNTAGNDETFPIPLTFRYNIVNGLVPTVVPYDKIGFLVNNEGVPEFNNFTFPAVPQFGTAPAYSTTSDGVLQTPYANSILTDAIDLKAFVVDASGNKGQQIFDIHAQRKILNNYTITSDMPVSIIINDTVNNKGVADSAKVKQIVVPLPDQAYPDSIRFVIINGISREKGVATTKLYAKFSINGAPEPVLSSGSGAAPGRYDTYDIPATSNQQVTISTDIPNGSNSPSMTFNAVPGAIYEVVLLGLKDNAHLTIIRLNPPAGS